jgi:hypothetical protein
MDSPTTGIKLPSGQMICPKCGYVCMIDLKTLTVVCTKCNSAYPYPKM